jgi:hypothetical protein
MTKLLKKTVHITKISSTVQIGFMDSIPITYYTIEKTQIQLEFCSSFFYLLRKKAWKGLVHTGIYTYGPQGGKK